MKAATSINTSCCIVGGGPAGMVTGLLLARQGVDVVVLEKHPDFHRDFRGDTIHPSTLELMRELGWLSEFLELPHTELRDVTVEIGGIAVTVADFSKLPVTCPYVAFVPQWDFLDFLARKAGALPGFRLLMETEVTELTRDGDVISGVRATTPDGPLDVRAGLVVGADGRHSIVREAAGLEVITSAAPMDVLWFPISRRNDETLPFFQSTHGAVVIAVNRGSYWQMAYVIPDGAYETLQAEGIDRFRARVARAIPPLADRVGELATWDDVRMLNVRVDHLRRWHRPGLLCVGDAAHAMSPAGGVGINLAVQDGVAAANLLGPILARGRTPTDAELQRVQRRRELPARLTQFVQVRALAGLYPRRVDEERADSVPLALRIFQLVPGLRHLTGRFVGLGVRPEHVGQRAVVR